MLDLDAQAGGIGLRVFLVGRIVAGEEQIDQPPRDLGIARQRVLHIGLAERDADLAQIFRIGAQHHDLARRHLRAQHQAIEAVAFHSARPDLREAILERRLDRGDVDFRHVARHHGEIA